MPLTPITEVILGDHAEKARAAIAAQAQSKSLKAAIDEAVTALGSDGQHGDNLPMRQLRRKQAYKPFSKRHDDPDNLYCINLPLGWRLLYTIVRDAEDIFVYILEIVDHKQYSKWFPGKRYK